MISKSTDNQKNLRKVLHPHTPSDKFTLREAKEAWRKHVRRFDEWREPAPDTKYVSLYRGDSIPIDVFSLDKVDPGALFGPGLYFTDSKKVATSYTTKGAGEGIVMNDIVPVGKTSAEDKAKAVEQFIVWHLVFYTGDIPFDARHATSTHSSHAIEDADKYLKEKYGYMGSIKKWDEIRANAQALYDRTKRNYRFWKGPAVPEQGHQWWTVIEKKTFKGAVTNMSVPRDWIDRCYDAETELDDDVEGILRDLVMKYSAGNPYTSTEAALKMMDQKYVSKQYGYTLGGFMYERRATWLQKMPIEGWKEFREGMKKLGYKGIRYQGGKYMGGLGTHNAYVFWDEQGIKNLRNRSKQTTSGE